MLQNCAAKLNGKHTYADYGLYVTNTNPVSPPEVRVNSIPIPGRNGNIDLTQALTGYTVYGNREIRLELGGKKREEEWAGFMSRFINEMHGKNVEVIFDEDPQYYYVGRAAVEADYERGNTVARFTVSINAEPYKYDIQSTTEPWLWDTFSFVDGIIRYYASVIVDGEKDVRVIGSPMPVIPIMTASTAMTIRFEGEQYALAEGINKVYDIVLYDQEYILKFTGNGTVSINYRSGRL